MRKLTVSIIIPSYNSVGTIKRALDSAFCQSYQDTEIIVVDDGSTDNTYDIVSSYGEKIRYFKQKNMGAAAARNKGVLVSSGEYISFLDADDMWHPNKLKFQLEALINNPDIGFCSTKVEIVSEKEAFKHSKNKILIAENIRIEYDFKKIFLNPYFGTPSVTMKKSHYMMCGGMDETLQTAEDIDLWLRASFEKGVVVVEEPLTYIIGKSDSLTKTTNFQTFKDNLIVVDRFCTSHDQFSKSNLSLIRKVKARIYTEWGSAVLSNNHYKDAANLFTQSLKYKFQLRAIYLLSKAILSVFKIN